MQITEVRVRMVNGNGGRVKIAHPITGDFRLTLQGAVLAAYREQAAE